MESRPGAPHYVRTLLPRALSCGASFPRYLRERSSCSSLRPLLSRFALPPPQATVGEPQPQLHNEASALLWKHEAPHSDRTPLVRASSPSTALRRSRRRLHPRSCAKKGSTLQRIPCRFLLSGEDVDPLPQLHDAA